MVQVASWAFGHAKANFASVCRLYEEAISKEMNNDLNLHHMTKLSGWLHACMVPTFDCKY